MFRIETTPRFERLLSSFVKAHPDLRERTRLLIDRLAKNPGDPRNKMHALIGRLKGCYAASISWNYRIFFIWRVMLCGSSVLALTTKFMGSRRVFSLPTSAFTTARCRRGRCRCCTIWKGDVCE